MRYWIIPYKKAFYRLDELFEKHDEVVWRNNNKIEIGDIAFMYSSAPIQRLTYVMRVIDVGKGVVDRFDDTQYQGKDYTPAPAKNNTKPILLKLKQRLSEDMRLSFNDLRSHGLTSYLQGKTTVDGALLDYILNEIDRDITLEASPDFINDASTLPEGAVMQVTINKYERNRSARERCIAAHGCRCVVCGIDFGQVYGEVGKGFIHVHHIVPLASIGKSYRLNPEKDLVPVCPNCHAMLHRAVNGKLMSIDQLRSILKKQ